MSGLDGRRRGQLISAAAGGVLFLAVQAMMVNLVSGAVATADPPWWFLNSGRNVAIVAAVLASGAAVLALTGSDILIRATAFAGGAMLAMIALLFVIGPGSIFPIVIVVGGVVMSIAVACGAVVGRLVRVAVPRH
jgi:hypothetical protein